MILFKRKGFRIPAMNLVVILHLLRSIQVAVVLIAVSMPSSSKALAFTFDDNIQRIKAIQPISNRRIGMKIETPTVSRSKKTSIRLNAIPGINDFINHLPFQEASSALFQELNIGEALKFTNDIPEDQTSMVLESIGRDLLVFLAASVIVTPTSQAFGLTPILGYLIIGALLGPHAMNIFSNTKADVELGDFGILFLLFSEGLEVTTTRLQKLTNYVPLGLAQISLTAAVLTAGILSVPEVLERFIPLDGGLINVQNPIEALILALAGTLSTSAFVFPVLKEKEWEDEKSGEAATSVLLLQDLAVAPLLVLLPFVAGQGVGDGGSTYSAVAFLTLKATLGFGSVIVLGSYLLRNIFNLVAKARSTETFVALCLLVSVGMGTIAKSLGLTDTAGAFAAGVLLANTNYRAQVQADILPFKGILLGIFFMDAGSSFDLDLVLSELPTVMTGVLSLLLLKAGTVYSATKVPRWMEPNRLPERDAIKLSLLLAGGGEFAFVVLAVAERLNVLPTDLGGLLTAIVLISMALTPLLGDAADRISTNYSNVEESESSTITINVDGIMDTPSVVAEDAIVVCGYGEIGKNLVDVLGENIAFLPRDDTAKGIILPKVVSFDTDVSLIDKILVPKKDTVVLYGDGANPEVLRSSGVTNPSAIFVSYQDHTEVLSATSRLRNAFSETPIFSRSHSRFEAQLIKAAGASEVVVEADELPRSAVALLIGDWKSPMMSSISRDLLLKAVAKSSNLTLEEVEKMLQWFECMDQEKSGLIEPSSLTKVIRKSNSGVCSDEEIAQMELWIKTVVKKPLDYIAFCKMFVKAPDTVKRALTDSCLF